MKPIDRILVASSIIAIAAPLVLTTAHADDVYDNWPWQDTIFLAYPVKTDTYYI